MGLRQAEQAQLVEVVVAPPLMIDTAPAFPVRTVAQQIESAGGTPLLAIPYYSRNNRGLAPMRVWLDTEPATDAER